MKLLNQRIRDDAELRGKVIRGQRKARSAPGYRAMQALTMRETMKRPELRRLARFHCAAINKCPDVRRKQWATRRRRKAEKGA